jgi:predicted nucleotidyltransferase
MLTVRGYLHQNDLTPLLIVLHGSRSRNLHTEQSDYDVKVIYTEAPKLFKSKDNFRVQLCANIEVEGWELRKLLSLCAKSNLSALEWANCSSLFAVPEFHNELSEIVGTFSLREVAFAYRGQTSAFERLEKEKRDKNVLRNRTLINYLVTEHRLPLVQDFSYYKAYETTDEIDIEHLPTTKVDKSRLEQMYHTYRSR